LASLIAFREDEDDIIVGERVSDGGIGDVRKSIRTLKLPAIASSTSPVGRRRIDNSGISVINSPGSSLGNRQSGGNQSSK
jgi:hypothetical protein